MNFIRALTILAIILPSSAAICQLEVEPFGFAASIDVDEEMIVELNLINLGENDIQVSLHALRPPDRNHQDRGPRRDDLGDVVDEFNIGGELWAGLAWDGELMWGLEYQQQRLTAVDHDGEIVENVNIEGEQHVGLCYDGEVFWTGYLGDEDQARIFRVNREGEVLGSIAVEGGAVFGVAWDGENLWYTDLQFHGASPSCLCRTRQTGL